MDSIPFLFCRYELSIDDERLDASGQLQALKELQGKYYPHGAKAREQGLFDSVIMRPRSFKEGRHTILTWSVGQRIGQRPSILYDSDADELSRRIRRDDSLRYADFIAVPALGVFAVDDRLGETRMGGRAAARRFRSIFRQLNGADANVVLAASYQDVQAALKKWSINSFMFTVRPYNPHSPSVFATRLAKALKKRRLAKASGRWESDEKKGIKADDEMRGIVDLSEAGYGQIAVKGKTPDGHSAHIKKPPFYRDRDLNLKAQDRPKELRIFIEGEDGVGERELFRKVAGALITQYED